MLLTKSIYDRPLIRDGVRVLVMRFKPKPYIPYEIWERDLSPSIKLFNDYKCATINWEEFERRFIEEMKNQKDKLKKLAELSSEENVTLLCWERNTNKCHRFILQRLIEINYCRNEVTL